jgi:hypothetical protein
MGIIWLEEYFPYDCIHTWFYKAADVTQVTSHMLDY